jgi:hypothetical protein
MPSASPRTQLIIRRVLSNSQPQPVSSFYHSSTMGIFVVAIHLNSSESGTGISYASSAARTLSQEISERQSRPSTSCAAKLARLFQATVNIRPLRRIARPRIAVAMPARPKWSSIAPLRVAQLVAFGSRSTSAVAHTFFALRPR